MNLQPVKHYEPITILMVPYDRYSAFPKAVDRLYKETDHPFKLVIVEGNAPENVRMELEDRKRKYKNIQIVYSDHHPRIAEAFNLGLVHVRTRRVVLMHNALFATPGWLQNLVEKARLKDGVLCPYISPSPDEPFGFLHAFLLTRERLEGIGLFDESVGAVLWGADLINRLKANGVPIHHEPSSVLEYRTGPMPKGADLRFFKHQWEDPHSHQTLAYFKQKWGSAPDEARYRDCLAKKKTFSKPKLNALASNRGSYFPLWLLSLK